jgi:phosphomannomutase
LPDGTEELIGMARRWSLQDPDPETRAEAEELLRRIAGGDAAAERRLAAQFSARLEFGTAGLRAELGVGPARMNRVVVSQSTSGLARFLLTRSGPERPHLVIGFDARTNSRRFAQDAAQIAAGAGLQVTLLPRELPTPVLAFAVRHLGAEAGVMITASHNPPGDNGYKVYLGGPEGNGAQVIPPHDRSISEAITAAAAEDARDLPRSEGYGIAPESLVDAYIASAASVRRTASPESCPVAVYTAMHGVGWETFRRAVNHAGLRAPIPVKDQIEPDPGFPTAAFPNPEEPGALDLAMRTANRVGADLILANDPDGDRLAVAAADPASPWGFRQLTGNEVGQLLGWRAAEQLHRTGRTGSLACSLVSSPALQAVARHYRLPFHQTGTGFKWISRAPDLAFGYEEAIGYLVDPDSVRDKDGISAGIAVLDLAADLAASGLTLIDLLNQFAETFGAFASDQIACRIPDPVRRAELVSSLRNAPPPSIGGYEVIRAGVAGTDQPVLQIDLDHGRIMARASGTEPKVKFYLDAWSTEGNPADRTRTAADRLAELRRGLLALIGRL